MKSEPINSTFAELIQQNSNLSSYLDSLEQGRPATPHSWVYEHEDASDTLNRWIPIMEAANNKTNFGDEFNQFDRKQIEKFGPQGKVPPLSSPEAQEVIEPLYSPSDYDDEEALSEFFQYTERFAKEVFGQRLKTNRPRSFKQVVDDMRERDTLSSNSGFPRFVNRKSVKEEEIRDAESGKAYEYPAILLFRQYYGKLRPIWMFPMSLNLIEGSFQQVLQESLLNSPAYWVRDFLSPWAGFEDVKKTLTRNWHGTPIVGGDTTKMDANMRRAQLRLVYEICKWNFQEQYWDALYKSIMHVTDIPMLYSKSAWYVGYHGLASGSDWTQISETVLDLFIAWLNKVTGQGIGDDFLWHANLSAAEVVEILARFGLPANEKKQSVGTDQVTFLQRLFLTDFFSREDPVVLGGYYPTIRALGSILLPEKFHKPKLWNSDMMCSRNYSILENTIDDPSFEEFVIFVAKGHEDMIPFAKKTDSELDAIQKKSRELRGLNPTYNQEKRNKPLSSYASIQIARKLG